MIGSFDKFERGLRADSAEVFGGKTTARKPGRPRKDDTEVEIGGERPWNTVKLQPELAAQVEAVADLLGINRSGFARMLVAAGLEAVLREIEETCTARLPLCLTVGQERANAHYRDLRTITPARFEALRARYPWELSKWKRGHPKDTTGQPTPPPMPRPQSKALQGHA